MSGGSSKTPVHVSRAHRTGRVRAPKGPIDGEAESATTAISPAKRRGSTPRQAVLERNQQSREAQRKNAADENTLKPDSARSGSAGRPRRASADRGNKQKQFQNAGRFSEANASKGDGLAKYAASQYKEDEDSDVLEAAELTELASQLHDSYRAKPRDSKGDVSVPARLLRKHDSAVELFEEYDADRSEFIDIDELRDMCYDLGYFLNDEELQVVMKLLDSNGDGHIEIDEFRAWFRSSGKFVTLSLAKDPDYQEAVRLFRRFDRDNNGRIDAQEWEKLWVSLFGSGSRLTKSQLKAQHLKAQDELAKLDTDMNGYVCFSEFLEYLKSIGII